MAASVLPASAATPPLRPPVIDGDWADPAVVHDPASGRFFTYATNFAWAGKTLNVPVRSSSSLTSWSTWEGDALPNLPGWAQSGLTWAPGVAQISGSWRLYFTARHRASGRQCVGVAHATRPQGPYTPISVPIVCQTDRGGSIDASPFQDPATGKWWLHWKSDENAPGASGISRLWAMELAGDALSVVGPARVILAYAGGPERPLIENPTMIANGGRYWLAYSANWWESYDYHDHLAQCSGPAGPCTRIGNPSDPWLSKASGIAGPGGGTFFTDAGSNAYVAFHGWRHAVGYARGGFRALHVEPVTFDGPGASPRLRPDLVREPARAPRPLYTTLRPEHGDVLRLYRAFFNREPDSAGARYWVSIYDQGHSLAVIADSFAKSEEFSIRYAGTTNYDYMVKIYANVLGRTPDTAGINYWVSILDQRKLTRGGVVLWISQNAEFKNRYQYTTMP